jgi:uncharacterized protein YjbI with pentapeptide repeats
MGEQQTTSTCPHPEAVGKRWGDPIGKERQAELQHYLDRWEAGTDHSGRKGPFDGVELCGAEVSWLVAHRRSCPWGPSSDLLTIASGLEGDAFLNAAHLHLEGADLAEAHLEGANLIEAHLQGTRLDKAHLEGARLTGAHLEGAWLRVARLEGADLIDAHLESAFLFRAHLEGSKLDRASFNKTSRLNEAVLSGASLDQTTFDNTNLSVVDWKKVPILGDELAAQKAKDRDGKRKSRQQRVTDYQAAVRAYRRIAVVLQGNGLSAESANYLYRASIMERRLARHERRVGAYFFSVLLAVLAGYGYRLGRIVVAYISVVAAFALAFLAARYLSGILIDWEQVGEATQISLNAIHGRVFFAQIALDSVQAWIATVESVVGIVIEGVFVAMLIQRFFGR